MKTGKECYKAAIGETVFLEITAPPEILTIVVPVFFEPSSIDFSRHAPGPEDMIPTLKFERTPFQNLWMRVG